MAPPPPVAATVAATGLSTGTCTNALKLLTDLELLESNAGGTRPDVGALRGRP